MNCVNVRFNGCRDEAVIVGSKKELGAKMGVNERTVRRWVRLPGFPTRPDRKFDTARVELWRYDRQLLGRDFDTRVAVSGKAINDAELTALLASLPGLAESMAEFDRIFDDGADATAARNGGGMKVE